MKRFKLFIPLFVFVVMALFLWRGLSLDPNDLPSPLIGKPMPEFNLASLHDSGKQLTSKDMLGQPYLVNIWATWCPTCLAEHDYLLELKERGVRILGVNYKDEREPALRWLNDLGDPFFLSVFDADGRLGLDLGVSGAPETFLVDAEGVIRSNHRGEVTQQVWLNKFAAFISAPPVEPISGE